MVVGSTVTPSNVSPLKLRVVFSPAARVIVPIFAVSIPSFLISGASSAMKLLSATLMFPWLTMLPVEPLRLKV